MSNVSNQVCEAVDLRREHLRPLALRSQFRSQFSQFFGKTITKPSQLRLEICNLSYFCLKTTNLGRHICNIFSGMEKLFILEAVGEHVLLGYGQDGSHLFQNHSSHSNFLLWCSLLGINLGFERIKLLIYLLKPQSQSPCSLLLLLRRQPTLKRRCHLLVLSIFILSRFVHLCAILLSLFFILFGYFRCILFHIHQSD